MDYKLTLGWGWRGVWFWGLGLLRPLVFALEARLTFFLLRQEESKQRRRRPWSTPGVARSLALLGLGGGTPGVLLPDAAHRSGRCGTRRYAAQTVLALYPPKPALLSVSQGARKVSWNDQRLAFPKVVQGQQLGCAAVFPVPSTAPSSAGNPRSGR